MDTPKFGPQQEAIIRAAAAGMGQKEIAKHLGMARATASTHLTKIYAKLGITSNDGQKLGSKLTAWAIQHGYGPQEDSNA